MTIGVRNLIKAFCFLIATAMLAIGVFVAKTIIDAPLNIFEEFSKETKFTSDLKQPDFLPGSAVKIDQFKNYLLFSNERKNLKEWMEGNSKNIRKINSKQIVIEKKVDVPFPLNNDCQIVYCYQHRLGFENIPPIFWKGLIGIEDERFLLHKGVDFRSLLRALIHDIKVMRLEQGGSTLTQQIVKNLFYSNEKKFSRKIKEMILAVYLESKYEKEKILESYFNEVVWGGKQGIKIKGVFAASVFYFFKKPDKVEPYEAAILIALLKGPNYYNPLTRQERLRSRADLVYKKLVNMNLFPPENGEKWGDKKWKSWIEELKRKQKIKPYRNNWWLSQNIKKSELGLYEKYVLNSEVRDLLIKIKERLKKKDIAVKAYFGSLSDSTSRYFYYSKYERNWEKAKSVEKQTLGSTIKPLIYSYLVDLGSDMEKEVETGPLVLKLKSGEWKPREAHSIPEEWVTLRKSLQKSYNRPLIREVMNIGFEKVESEMKKWFPELKSPLAEYPSQLLGAVEISIDQLFSIYSDFIKKECGKNDEDNLVEMMSDPKETTVRKLVGRDFGGLKFFHKTGTSNNGFDNWFVFYEGDRLGVIWVGLEGSRNEKDLKLYGGTTSFKIFKNFYLQSGRRFGEMLCGESSLNN